MKNDIDLKQVSTVFLTCLIGGIIIYMFFSMFAFSDRAEENQAKNVAQVMMKAAVTCYGLEGSYPTDIDYLATNYGIKLDRERFEYFYEFFGYNQMPQVIIIDKLVEKGGSENGQ